MMHQEDPYSHEHLDSVMDREDSDIQDHATLGIDEVCSEDRTQGDHADDVDEAWDEVDDGTDSSELFDFFTGATEPVEVRQGEDISTLPVSKALHINPVEEIRIMDLVMDGNFDSPLHCELRSVRLKDPGPYETISYTWGEPLPNSCHLSELIYCDVGDQTLAIAITKNLKEALQHIRKRESARDPRKPSFSVWTDAVCIDQAYAYERNSQVMMMADIYQRSASLSIWLGDEHKVPGELSLTEYLRRPPADEVLQRRWFSRRWVIQEVHSGVDNCMVGIDGLWASWNDFRLPLLGRNRSHPTLDLRPSSHSPESSRHKPLLELLQKYDSANCSEPLDIFYALRGISLDVKKPVVDYRRRFREVCIEVATTYATNPHTIHKVFCCTATRGGVGADGIEKGTQLSLPTWVPDWGAKMDVSQISLYKHLVRTESHVSTRPLVSSWTQVAHELWVSVLDRTPRRLTTPAVVISEKLQIPVHLVRQCGPGDCAKCTDTIPTCVHFSGYKAMTSSTIPWELQGRVWNVKEPCQCLCADCHLERAFQRDRNQIERTSSASSGWAHTYSFSATRVFGVLTDLRTVLVLEPPEIEKDDTSYTFYTCFVLQLDDLCKNFLGEDHTSTAYRPFYQRVLDPDQCCKQCYDESRDSEVLGSRSYSASTAGYGKIAATTIQIR